MSTGIEWVHVSGCSKVAVGLPCCCPRCIHLDLCLPYLCTIPCSSLSGFLQPCQTWELVPSAPIAGKTTHRAGSLSAPSGVVQASHCVQPPRWCSVCLRSNNEMHRGPSLWMNTSYNNKCSNIKVSREYCIGERYIERLQWNMAWCFLWQELQKAAEGIWDGGILITSKRYSWLSLALGSSNITCRPRWAISRCCLASVCHVLTHSSNNWIPLCTHGPIFLMIPLQTPWLL